MYTNDTCTRWREWALETIRTLRPQVVIISQFWSSWSLIPSHALEHELADVAALTPATVLVEDTPAKGRAPVDCLLARGATLGSCVFPVTSEQRAAYARVRKITRASNVRYMPTLQWLCAGGRCPTVIGNVIAFRDEHHLSGTYSHLLSGPFARLLGETVRPLRD
jgi:hypothetical protein